MANVRTSSLVRSRISYKSPVVAHRSFSDSAPRSLSPLMNLTGLSGSKEAQYLSKERRIPRTEFHPYLELIRASEVDPFAPVAGASPTVISALRRKQSGDSEVQAAYGQAISSLLQQLEASKQEVRQANAALAKLNDKYTKQERQALLITFCTVMLLSLVTLKTDILEDLGAYASNIKKEWKAFDWQWLGNPPPHKQQSQKRLLELAQIESPSVALPKPLATPKTNAPLVESEPIATVSLNQRPSLLSRMFWASPNRVQQ